ncbi:hypothetical protein [Glutamicibacter sp.]|uniref:hypothetical protein n=1 Tax=Glutamicibacter sp. TaxID=1931995 RepID=UPI0028BD1B21|nr:hypothetical protein [Glutamicibacter sp.]
MGVGTALAMAAVGITAVPSAADEVEHDSFSFSTDGRSFTHHPAPIFDDAVRMIPGDRRVGGIWIRNDHSAGVEMAVTPKVLEEESALQFTTIGESSFRLAPQEKTWIALQVELPKGAGNLSAGRTELLQLQVRFSELAAEGESPSPTPDQLPDTGFGSWPLFAGLALVVAGMVGRTILSRMSGANSNEEGSHQ